ncbi:glycoside hydrolase family 3 [Pyrenophora seminiperda CCB06]|uniref:beta-glucosidase n=1 Tax=Pyrenophora seminiperda CCB06 TaxID=1302712 RepID=A0A3M7MCR7_9PLEO|nr:glycoside hydrolase family 3 [Pyrenophora seminiperda CCB06]
MYMAYPIIRNVVAGCVSARRFFAHLDPIPIMASLLVLGFSAIVSGAAIHHRDAVPAGYVAAPYYPAPHGGWTADWSGSYRKASMLVSNMTLAEKTNLTAGTGIFMGRCVGNTGSALRVGIPQLCLQDGPLGVRNTDHNTAFPPGITVGATWDKDLIKRRGIAIGEEFRGKGVNVHLGPSVGPLGRKPRGGRNWEGFGADPVLQAFGGALTVEGVQSTGVIATIKHLIANEQEEYRMWNLVKPGYSSNVDDRTLHELYLWPFAEGVRAGVGSVMISYNAVNGSASAQNSHLINGLLKDELGFQGFVMSDWLAQISGVPSTLAGLDMSMPGDKNDIPLVFGTSYWMYEQTRSVLNGSVPVDRVNDAVTRILAAYFQMGQDQNYPRPNFDTNTQDAEGPLYPGLLLSPRGVVNEFVDVQGNHAEVAREVARDAITLLKNDGGILPLTRNASLKIFGTDAEKNPDGINSCADQGCNKGTLGMGWGSGSARYPYMDSPIDGFKARGATYQFFNTDSFPGNSNPSPNDTAVVFVTADSGENYITVENNPGDRTSSNLNLWHNGDKLIKDVAAKYSNVIVVVHTVGPILMNEWHDLPSVKAVLFAHLPGQEAGDSLMQVLFGDVSPSGHLPYTLPVSEDDYPKSVGIVGYQLGQPQDTYTEGLYIDYRHFHKANVTPKYAFGHGLSYTSFSFSDATITPVTPLTAAPPTRPAKGQTPTYSTAIPPASEAVWPANFPRLLRYIYSYLDQNDADAARKIGDSASTYPYPAGYSNEQKPGPAAGGAQGGNPALFDTAYNIAVTVTNTGSRAGKAVAQLYVQFPSESTVDTPVIQLRDFEKTSTLAAGASQTLNLRVTRKDLSVWDVVAQNWVVPAVGGDYGIWIGGASDQLRLRCGTASGSCGPRDPPLPGTTTPSTDFGANTHYGCVIDSARVGQTSQSSRLLNGPYVSRNSSMTQQSCKAFCTIPSDAVPDAPYKYFAIEFGRDCRCGTIFLHTPVISNQCHTTCVSSSSQLCGGQNVMNLWLNSDYVEPSTPTGPGNPDNGHQTGTPPGGNPDNDGHTGNPPGGNPDNGGHTGNPPGGNPDNGHHGGTPTGGNPDNGHHPGTPTGGHPGGGQQPSHPRPTRPDHNPSWAGDGGTESPILDMESPVLDMEDPIQGMESLILDMESPVLDMEDPILDMKSPTIMDMKGPTILGMQDLHTITATAMGRVGDGG